ncbi:MAG: hypothetical protein ABI619_03870 [Betaproteobacteria bacterium]
MQNIDKIIHSLVIVCSVAAASTVVAAEPWDAGGSLDACIAATLKERPGIVTGWQQSGGGDAPPYVISILNAEGSIAEAFCDPVNPSSFQFTNKMGLYRYSMYERATWPETRSRIGAQEIFTPPVRLTSMELAVNFSGRPTYKYQMILPSRHKAVVEMDGVTGRLANAQVN